MDGGVTLFSANFDTDEEGFVFRDDAFRSTNQPLYAGGQHIPAGGSGGGALQVLLGGVDDADIDGMSGGWDRDFTLTEPQQVTLTFRVKLTQTADYEPDEFSEALVALNGTLLSANGGEAIARIAGNGNGGPARTTDWIEVEIDLGILDAGDHTLTFGGFNNKKTLANEETEILFDDIEVKAAPPPDSGTLIDADFDTDTNGFVFRDDAFRDTDQPLYADGQRIPDGGSGSGALQVLLGGVDDADVNGMSGGWDRDFTLTEPQQVTLTFRVKLTQTADYEPDEFSEALVALNGTLLSANGGEAIARIAGNGNGGPARTTDWIEVEIDLGILDAGDHTLTFGGFNNKKTLANEETEILFDDIEVKAAPPPPDPGEGILIDADFDTDTNGFVFVDDAFRGTGEPGFADGRRSATGGFSGGALEVTLGGIDDSDVNGMSGGWQTGFTLAEEAVVTISFRYNLTQAPNYEADEFSQVLLSLDGTLVGTEGNDFIAQIAGDGNGGPARSTGWQVVEINLGLLGPGDHELIIGGFNNRKTLADEETALLIDDVLVRDLPPPPPGDVVLIQSDFDTDTGGFGFIDDAFRGTDRPDYADGLRSPDSGFGSGGALEILLGGVDDSDVNGMSGGWQQSFTLTEETNVTLTFRFKLTQALDYEADEFSQVLVSLNGTLVGLNGEDFIAQIAGDGNGGLDRVVGWQVVELDLGLLGPGTHELILGGFNNKKTLANEVTEILFDDLLLTAERTAPAPPVIESIADDTGASNADGITSDTDLLVSGTAEPGTTVELFLGGVTSLGTTTADPTTGAWSIQTGPLPEGAGTLTATATDSANNTSAPSAGFDIVIDTILPGIPLIAGIADDSGTPGDGITNDTDLLVSGLGEAGTTVELFLDGATPLGTAVVDGSGNWSIQTGPIAEGPHTLSARATDLAGGTSPVSLGFDIEIDTTAPNAPVIDGIADDTGASGSDGITSDDDLLVSGTAEPGTTVELFLDGTVSLGTAAADATTGAWSIQAGTIVEGSHVLTAKATDTAGNTSAASAGFAIEIDTTAPAVPTIASIADDTDTPGDGITSDNDLLVSGTAEPGTTVELFLDGFTSLGTAQADATTGAWSIQTGVLANGAYVLTATATDTAGNTSVPSAGFDIEIEAVTPVLALSSLDGANGFVIVGIDEGDQAGNSVSDAGDVNGDGFEDVIIGTFGADGGPDNTADRAGESYVVFGRASGFGSILTLSSLDGSNGFLLAGIDGDDNSGRSVSGAGDVNGDGFADLIVGARNANGGPGNPANDAGEAYVVFGQASGFGSVVALSSLDGSNGFLLAGIDGEDFTGYSVSGAGDVNGDGFDDIIVGAGRADGGPGDPAAYAGESYIVFGQASGFGSVLTLSSLDGSNGFLLPGIDGGDNSGTSVSGAGDVNGDGLADLIVGAQEADGGPGDPNAGAGESYVVFGRTSGFGSVLALSSLDGSNGFVIAGIDAGDDAGDSVSSAGDLNGDGFADLVIGADDTFGGPGNPAEEAGEAYVVFGRASGFGSVLALSSLDGSNGFLIAGIDSLDRLGDPVSNAGDVNGDGLDDLIIGADRGGGGPGNPTLRAGEAYVVFGRASGFGSLLDLTALTADQGFLIAGIDADDRAGQSVSGAGDVNGDGFADLIVGASSADGGPGNPTDGAGESYIIFGDDFTGAVTQQGDETADTLTGTGAVDRLLGAQGDDVLDGDGGADVLYGGEGDDEIRISDASFQRIDGGTGTDTVVIDAPSTTIDLTQIADSKLQGIERIDLNSGSNTLVLSPLEVLNLSDSSNRLVVFGEPGDSVQASGEWLFQGFEQVDGVQVAKYASGAAQLWIQTGVKAELSATIALADLGSADGAGGFVIPGIDGGDTAGQFVSGAGDVNGDGFEDVIVGARSADGGPGDPTDRAGESYVIFGKASGFGSLLALSSLDGSNGFVLAGIDEDDFSGFSVSGAGDVNGDGFADLIVGTGAADGGPGNPTDGAGESYVVFGRASGFGSLVSLSSLDGSNGFVLAGIDERDYSGRAVSGAGDINGDGLADLIVSANDADGGPGNPTDGAGESYVVFGKASGFGSVVELSSLDGSNGFTIAGIDQDDNLSRSLSGAGDVNGDGFADLIVGTSGADGGPGNPTDGAGEGYVVFGKASGFGSLLDLSSLDGSNGFLLAGIDAFDNAGFSVSGAGDVNGDGFADLIVGAADADGGPGDPTSRAGESYVVFGKASGFGSVVELSSLDGSNGFAIAGIDENDFSGRRVSGVGDVNGDGLDDVMIGARIADGGPGNPTGNAGESYIIFGRASGFGSLLDLESLTADRGFVIAGIDEEDLSGRPATGAGDVNGDGFADIVIGASFADGGPGNPAYDAGESYIIFGGDFTGAVTQQGGETADTLTGTGAVDRLLGAQGDDVLIGGGGVDVLYGGEGDDRISVSDLTFLRVDGGTGTDTLVIDAPGTTVDLTQIADSKLQGIERIDLNFDSNTLILSPLEVLNLSDNSNRLVVFGEPGNEVQASGEWVLEGSEIIGADSFNRYVSGEAVLLIQDGVTQTLNFTLPPPTLDNVIAGSVDGFTGFRFTGEGTEDYAGRSVSNAGDVNGDGFEDFLIGSDRYPAGADEYGAAYVVFGGQDFAALDAADGSADGSLSLSNVGQGGAAGIGGFRLLGENPGDFAGFSVSTAGDIDGDGLADLVVGAYAGNGDQIYSGVAYLVFGDAGLTGQLLLSDVGATGPSGIRGARLNGDSTGDDTGRSVSSVGDINGDGFDDLIIGAQGFASGNGDGAAYVVYGGQTFPDGGNSLLNTVNPFDLQGFRLNGAFDSSAGLSVSSAGDVNGDGIDDLLVGADRYDGLSDNEVGAAYVVFGGQDFQELDAADGDDEDGLFLANVGVGGPEGIAGFRLLGEAEEDYAGRAVSAAGDVNGDGFADVIVGAERNDDGGNTAGAAYVIFGNASLSGQLLLADVGATGPSGIDGFRLIGQNAGENLGDSVSGVGDVNGDGFDDLIIGADEFPGDDVDPGAVYVVFGGQDFSLGDFSASDIGGALSGFLLVGEASEDDAGDSVSGAGDVNGDGIDDLLIGARQNDAAGNDAGAGYIVFGGDFTQAIGQLGDETADTLTGSAAADVLIGAQGDDVLDGNGGADVLYGGEGDDEIRIADTGFQRIDGGTGTDTLVIDAPDTTIDLGTIADNKLQGIERIDLNFDSNTLVLSPLEILNLSDGSNRLVVFGELGNEVQASGDWAQDLNPVQIDGVDFQRFTSGQAELLIQDGVTATLNATPALQLSSLDGDNGFVLVGIDQYDFSSFSVSDAGDVNGDGFEDVIIGAHLAAGGPGDPADYAGESYVVFGAASGFGSVLSLSSLDGSNGFLLAGIDADDYSGRAVSGAGDVNGDGFADLIVGAHRADGGSNEAGESYVVFGAASGFGSVLSLSSLDGSNGFLLAGIDVGDYSGRAVSGAGDVNGDGFADLIVGALEANGGPGDPAAYAGESYVVFGAASGFGSVFDFSSLDGSNGFIIVGSEAGDKSGYAVSGAGDVNGDGFADLIIGAEYGDGGPGDPAAYAGESYVVFGRSSGFGSILNLSSLDGSNGFVIAGIDGEDYSGESVSGAGDLNGDGFADLVIGAEDADGGPGNPVDNTGEAYVVFGKASGFGSSLSLSALDGSNGFIIAGIDVSDDLGDPVSNAGDVNGDGFDDIIVAAEDGSAGPGDPVNGAGENYVIFGSASGFASVLDMNDLRAGQGFLIVGIDARDEAGESVSGAGDVNGDGFADLIIGADRGDGGPGNPTSNTGESYIVFGGDFTGSVTQQGDETANTLTGSGAVDVLLGAQGDDTLIGNGGADVLYGGEGDDRISVSDLTFQRVDGGTGTDTLVIDAPGTTIDLTTIADSKLQGIERIDLNFDNNTLILSPLEVLNLSDSSNRLVVFGEPGNEVQASGEWVQSPGFVSVGGEDFVRYTSGAAELLIQDGVTQTLTVVFAPSAPAIDSIADDTGASAVDGITSDDDLLVIGTAEPGTTVELFLDGGTSLGTTTADGTTGAWSIQTGTIAEGAYTLTATAASGPGFVSLPSAGFAIEIDTKAPTAPVIAAIADDTGTSAVDGLTSDDDLLVSGTAEPGTAVELFLDGGTSLGTTVADGTTGAWSIQTGVLPEGPHVLTATATDAAGNESLPSAGFPVQIDTSVPAAPTITSIADDTYTPGDGITRDNELLVSGTAEAGSTVELFLDGAKSLGTTVADGTTGAWSIQTGVIAVGAHTLTATATNTPGAESAPSAGFPIEILPTFPVLELSSLDGSNGFVLAGIDQNDASGLSVSGAGDVNGDGFEDVIIGSLNADGGPGNPVDRAGESYVVFGKASGFGSVLNLSTLDGSNGFILAGIDSPDESGRSVSGAGDVNGDGFADVIVGTQFADGGPGDPVPFAGESYVVFGQASGFGSVLNLSSLDGNNGFLIAGTVANSETGIVVSGAGDFNGDGLADLIVGGPYAGAGRSYLVFGQASGFGSVLSLSSLDGSNGFLLSENTGAAGFSDRLGFSVSDAGDVNGDGLGDVIVGAFNVKGQAGESYVVFGQASGFGSELALSSLDGSNGFILAGIDGGDLSGISVSGAGDINGDGFADVIVGAINADGGPGDPALYAGESYVVFGGASGFASMIDLSSLDGSNGFILTGIDGGDFSGRVSDAGDVNGDGLDDLIIGANGGDGGPDQTPNNAGESYVVFGRATGFGSLVDLDDLSSDLGFVIAGIDPSDVSGRSVSGAGDVNGDGFADLIVGAMGGNAGPANTLNNTGESYIIFGSDLTGSVTQQGDETSDTLTGTGGNDVLHGAQGGDTLIGNGGADVLYGGEGDDEIRVPDGNFLRVDGGTGTDTLVIDVPGTTLDLTAIADSKLRGIEQIDLNFNSNALVLSPLEVLNLSDSYNRLVVFGEAGNEVQASGIWASVGTEVIGLDTFDRFISGEAELLIQDGVTQTLTIAVTTPVITGFTEDTDILGDGLTRDNDLLVSGTADPNATVELFLDGATSLGTAVADVTTGAWSIQTGVIADGPHVITAIATDSSANVSAPSAGLAIEINAAAPPPPTIDSIADDTGASAVDGLTSDDDLLVSGTAEPGTTVELFLDGGSSLGTTVADGTTGAWSIQTGAIADGPHTLTATASNGPGADSVLSDGFAIEIDTAMPAAPTIDSIADDTGTSAVDGLTSDDDLLVSGTAEPGTTVELFLDGGTSLGTTVADGTTGAWSIQTGVIADGPHTLTATATDAAGNESAVSAGFAIEIDTTAPAAPTIASIADDTDTPGDGITTDDELLVSGTAEAGSTVELFLDGGTSLGATVADGTTGAWSIQTGGIAVGVHVLTATVTDAAGNESAVSAGFPIEILSLTPVLELSSLDGSNGFVLAGIDQNDASGLSVSGAGDMNGDGFEDVIIGSLNADGGPGNPVDRAGESYVVFGKASGFGSVLNLSTLDGSNGFILAGIDNPDESGRSVSGAGDVNGDGFADVIVGTQFADGGPGDPVPFAGESYVVFGQASGFGSVLNLSSLDGNNGFLIAGTVANSETGIVVSGAGDFNGDGLADLIVGGPYAGAGRSYLVFGQASGFGSVLSLSSLDGSNGFLLSENTGAAGFSDRLGFSVSDAGDVNGDGLGDVIVGAFSVKGQAGESYVVFGQASGFGSELALSSLDGSNGFILAGIDGGDLSGISVSGAGDINGDGFADVIVGAINADGGPGDPALYAGESYVVFGGASGFASTIDLSSLDGSNGFILTGIDAQDRSGAVSNAGDVNGDGLDDLIIGAFNAAGGPDQAPGTAGESYVVFGRATGFGSLVDLDDLSSDLGFVIAGIDPSDVSGRSVSGAGDVNGDGFADLIVGAPQANAGPANTPNNTGESYIVFGSDLTGSVTQQGDETSDTLTGTGGNDVLLGAQGDDTLIGNGGADVLYGGEGDDILAISDATLARLNGGTGDDTLRLDGAGFSLDLTALSDLKVEEIEVIDLQEGAGSHSLSLDLQEVLNLSDTSNTLTILGDGADTVDIGAGWTLAAGTPAGFDTYTQGAATLVVDADIVIAP